MPLARVHNHLLTRFGCASEEGAILFREFVEAIVRVAHHQTQEALPLEAKVSPTSLKLALLSKLQVSSGGKRRRPRKKNASCLITLVFFTLKSPSRLPAGAVRLSLLQS
jgi:hypothetical protein